MSEINRETLSTNRQNSCQNICQASTLEFICLFEIQELVHHLSTDEQ